MADIRVENSDYIVWVLKSEYDVSLQLKQEPGGWNDEDYKLTRHKKYHGVFTSFTNSLVFQKDAIDYIENAYKTGGINTNLYLTRLKLREYDGEIKWKQDYFGLADFSTKVKKGNTLEMNFNSNELEELIKSHESDTFEIERLTSIDDLPLDKMGLFNIKIEGRSLSGIGETSINLEEYSVDFRGEKHQRMLVSSRFDYQNYYTFVTKTISNGATRFTPVTAQIFPNNVVSAANNFWDNEQTDGSSTNITVDYDVDFVFQETVKDPSTLEAFIQVSSWDGSAWNVDEKIPIAHWDFNVGDVLNENIKGTQQINDLAYNQGVALVFSIRKPTVGFIPVSGGYLYSNKHSLKVSSSDFYEASSKLNFTFVHDCINRLMYILTGEKTGRFYSRFFGRKELGYKSDGEGGLIGLISGFWVRAFDPLSEKYKSLQISLEDMFQSIQAVNNVGIGVEQHNLKQRLRVEALDYFYQDSVVVRLPNQVSNVVRKVDKNLFFSGTEFGYQHGGEYEAEVGLDEPNTRTKFVTPIHKSKLKFSRVSKIRGDDTGLELTRRKPQVDYPNTDTSQDTHNWFLDVKRELNGFVQKNWDDRLQQLPTGISMPESFRSMFFTPLRMMLRHGWVFRSGLEPYTDSKFKIKYASSAANSTLTTWFKDEAKPFTENEDILVNELERSRFLPETITFKHAVDDDLMDLIKSSTSIEYNGEIEAIPNIYFKFEWLNEDGEYESGYLKSLKPKGAGEWEFIKANDNILN